MKYLKRLLGLPFFLMLNIIGMIFHLFTLTKFFILYGGEAIAYDKKNTPKMIANIYDELVEQNLAEKYIKSGEIGDYNEWMEFKNNQKGGY